MSLSSLTQSTRSTTEYPDLTTQSLAKPTRNYFKGDFFLVHGTKAMTIFRILITIITINTMMTLNIWTMITITVTGSFSSYRIITKIIVTDRNITLTRGIFF